MPPIEFTTPKEATEHGINTLVAGPSGAGKTVLLSTTGGRTCLVNSEGGLLSIRNTKADIQVFTVNAFDALGDIYEHLTKPHDFEWVAIDSISEVAEICLQGELRRTKDPRQAYGEMIAKVTETIRLFRDLPLHVVMTAKQDRIEDENNRLIYVPSAPGKKLAASMPYLFDLVMALRVVPDEEGNLTRWLQTDADSKFEAKDRSGRLDLWEAPNLADIKNKILNGTNKPKPKE